MSNLTYLWLSETTVDGSLQELQNLELMVLHIDWPEDPWAVKGPLRALQQMRSLLWLGLQTVDAQGSVATLADLSLTHLMLKPLDRHQVTGSVQYLRAMPLVWLTLSNCDIDGPMGVLGTLQAIKSMTITYTSIHGSLHALLGMPNLRRLTLRGLASY